MSALSWGVKPFSQFKLLFSQFSCYSHIKSYIMESLDIVFQSVYMNGFTISGFSGTSKVSS